MRIQWTLLSPCVLLLVNSVSYCFQVHQKGKIGILLDFVWYEPYTYTEKDKAAAQRARDFHLGW